MMTSMRRRPTATAQHHHLPLNHHYHRGDDEQEGEEEVSRLPLSNKSSLGADGTTSSAGGSTHHHASFVGLLQSQPRKRRTTANSPNKGCSFPWSLLRRVFSSGIASRDTTVHHHHPLHHPYQQQHPSVLAVSMLKRQALIFLVLATMVLSAASLANVVRPHASTAAFVLPAVSRDAASRLWRRLMTTAAPPATSAASSYSSSAGSAGRTAHGASSSPAVVLDPLVICGPSGVGKGTIIERYMSSTLYGGSAKFGFSVSHTTREPREGEVHGIHYHFVSHEEMRGLVAIGGDGNGDNNQQGYFLESAQVHGNWYGTSFDALRSVQQTGKRALLDVDVQGVQRIKSLQQQQQQQGSAPSTTAQEQPSFRLEPKIVFIAPPSLEHLRERLVGRKSETPETLERRLKNAAAEVEFGLGPGNVDAVVTNDDLDQAVRDFAQAVERLYPA